jgi:hypothetical protein
MTKTTFVVILAVLLIAVSIVVMPGCNRLLGRTSSSSTANQPPPPPPPPPRPDIKVTAVIPQTTVSFGDIFNMIIVVSNYGPGPANNAHVYGRANPAGYLEVLQCQPAPQPLAPSGFMFNIGEIYPSGRSDIRMTIRAPQQFQIGNIPGMNIGVRFTYDYFYQNVQQPEMPCGDLTFSLSQTGGILFFKASGY